MDVQQPNPKDDSLHLNVFCGRQGEAWRFYLGPGWCPPFLGPLLDAHGEAYPVLFDFDDLNRHLTAHEATVEQRWSRLGSVELTASGRSAMVLARWLTTALSSGVRL